uniref:RING-type E3 ubiquitin transferase n=1 Tax=Arundo donax TaxID=35708 RepID=A0A0A9CZU4_ARUDO
MLCHPGPYPFGLRTNPTWSCNMEKDLPAWIEHSREAHVRSSGEYDDENPRSTTKCDHHFHLCCILEWMERSDTCPVCDQITLVDEMFE